jgi:hypothetical protein
VLAIGNLDRLGRKRADATARYDNFLTRNHRIDESAFADASTADEAD